MRMQSSLNTSLLADNDRTTTEMQGAEGPLTAICSQGHNAEPEMRPGPSKVMAGQNCETEYPAGTGVPLRRNMTRSRSRGRGKSRSKSVRRHQEACPPSRSASRPPLPVPQQQKTQQPSSQNGQFGSGTVGRTWANVAKVMTKGYSLTYVPPLVEDGEVVVDISPEVAAAVNPRWLECLVGHYVGKKVPFKMTEEAIKRSWGEHVVDIKLHENGFFFFHIPNAEFRRKLIELGPISIFSSTMLLQQWHPKIKLKKGNLDTIPVWVRLRDVPFSLWSATGLSCISSAIGKPLYVDTSTEQMNRISYARVCVEIKAGDARLESIKVRWDGEVHLINIEYEWKPLACPSCGVFGHKMGTHGFACAPALARPVSRPELAGHHQSTGEWIQVSRHKGKSPLKGPNNQVMTTAGTPQQVIPSETIISGADTGQQRHTESNSRRPSFDQATTFNTSLCDAISGHSNAHLPHHIEDADIADGHLGVRPAAAGNSHLNPATPGLQVPPGGEEMHTSMPKSIVAAVPIHTGSVMIVQEISSARSSPSLELNHPDILVQQNEASPVHSPSSAEHSSTQTKTATSDESVEHGGLLQENSEGHVASELAALSPPATRSRTMASNAVEDHDKAAGPSSSKKKAKKAKNRRLKLAQQ